MTLTTDLASLIPIAKYETEKASELVRLGFPAVEPVMPQILEWLQDPNWPVGLIFQPFLIRIGQPLTPYIRTILAGQDDGWKYSLLVAVVAPSIELAQTLRPELEHLATSPSTGESEEEVDLIAVEILDALRNGTPEA